MNADKNVESVRQKMHQRALLGLNKYGVTTERRDLSTLDWLNHAQQEAMDLAVYLERLIRDEQERIKSTGSNECGVYEFSTTGGLIQK